MGYITLKEYCERHGYKPNTLRKKASMGGFKTAKKIGRDWFIEEDEEVIDRRVTTGKYIGSGWYKKYGKKRRGKKKDNG